MPGYLIAEVVDSIDHRSFRAGEKLFSRLDQFPVDLMVIAGGKIVISGPDDFTKELSKGDAIGEIMIPGMDAARLTGETEEAGSALLIGSGRLFDLMAKYDQITKIFIAAWDKTVIKPEVLT
jgi:hypothetical protein